jgi:hypothetical protein
MFLLFSDIATGTPLRIFLKNWFENLSNFKEQRTKTATLKE